MCRLFALAATAPVSATFWLIDAPDSLDAQSHRNPDGCGLGWYDGRDRAHVDKQPIAAYADREFAREARERTSKRFISHVRYASVGANTRDNTHPFTMDERIFAHNGGVGRLDLLDAELGPALRWVHGDTDSERVFALITARIRKSSDVRTGLLEAVRWVSENLPVYALNIILATPDAVFALRWPDTHTLYLLDRRTKTGQVDHLSSYGTRIRSDEPVPPTVAVASEPMDDDPGWQLLAPGELVEIADPGPAANAELRIRRDLVLPDPPTHPMEVNPHDPH